MPAVVDRLNKGLDGLVLVRRCSIALSIGHLFNSLSKSAY